MYRYPKTPVIYCSFERVELIKLEDLGMGHYLTTPQYIGVLLCNCICNLYHIFVYVHIIYLVVICFKQIFLYHGRYYNLSV